MGLRLAENSTNSTMHMIGAIGTTPRQQRPHPARLPWCTYGLVPRIAEPDRFYDIDESVDLPPLATPTS